MKAANTSWSETDKLYVSVCSALVALAALFGHSTSESRSSMAVVGVLALLLSINWMWLIRRYRRKILAALEGLAAEHKGSRMGVYFAQERQRFEKDRSDYLIALLVLLLSLAMIFYSITSGANGTLCV